MADTTPTTPIKLGPIATKPRRARTDTYHGIEKASQTYLKGAFVMFDPTASTGGSVQECTAPILASAPTTSITLGIAQFKATGTTGKEVMIDDAQGAHIEITLSTTASAHTLAQADVGKLYTISRDSASLNWYLQDVAATEANGGAFVVQLKDPIGTVDGRVIARITKFAIQGA
jgi:hypothetical protein